MFKEMLVGNRNSNHQSMVSEPFILLLSNKYSLQRLELNVPTPDNVEGETDGNQRHTAICRDPSADDG